MLHEQSINTAAFDYYGRLGRVKRFVDEHYADHVTLKKVADVACLEAKYFSTYFHSKTGVRFVDWVAWVRVKHAMQLLKQTDKPVTAISAVVGFVDLRSFERAFKKWTDMTPSRFRKSVRPS